MQDETTPQAGEVDAAAIESLSFEEFERWRETGEMPSAEARQTSAAADGNPEGAAETDSESDPGQDQESDDNDENDDDQPESRPKKGGFQRRIDKLTREKRELAERLARFEQPGLAGDSAADPADESAAGAPGKPVPEDFETYDEYVEKLTDWKLEQKELQKAADAASAAKLADWNQRLDGARSRYEDFDQTVESDVPVSEAMQRIMLESDQGPDLAYWLGKHPREAERISQLSPLAAARELGRIEAGLPAGGTTSNHKPRASASAAPPPVRPVGGANRNLSLDDPDIPFDEWERRRTEQLMEGRRR